MQNVTCHKRRIQVPHGCREQEMRLCRCGVEELARTIPYSCHGSEVKGAVQIVNCIVHLHKKHETKSMKAKSTQTCPFPRKGTYLLSTLHSCIVGRSIN